MIDLFSWDELFVCSFECYMMTSSNENISALLAFCAGNSPVNGEFPANRPVTRSLMFSLILNQQLSKQWYAAIWDAVVLSMTSL